MRVADTEPKHFLHAEPPARRPSRLARITFAALAGALLFSPTVRAADPIFTNQTVASGLSAIHSPTYPDGFLAGGAVGDFDRDGWPDVFVATGGGGADRLYMNNGDGTFTDMAASYGVALSHRGTSASVGDYDGDGWLDLFVTSFDGNLLYHNDGGASFSDTASAAGLVGIARYGGAFGDYDLDGDLDLAVVDWATGSNNRLYRNEGDGTFTDVSVASGVRSILGSINGFTVRFVDMDGDRYPELLWVGDFGTTRYLINDGDGTFTNGTFLAGVGFDGTEMGHTVADFDRNGFFDWYVTTISTNNLYMNNGGHDFDEISASAGVAYTGWGWATVAHDFDHDRKIDIAATSQSSGQFFLHNVSSDVSTALAFLYPPVGFSSSVSGRGLSSFDYDRDGDLDLVVFPRSGAIQLFRNDLDATAGDAHWISIRLDRGGSTTVPPDGIGAVLTVDAGGITQIGFMDCGSNYLSQSDMLCHFGLGSAAFITELHVDWPDGETTILEDIAVDQFLTIERAPSAPRFTRGDANGDGAFDISDAITLLSALFSGAGPFACEDAADANDDGAVDVSDAVSVLGALFLSEPVAGPFPECGPDASDDLLDCGDFPPCP